MNASRRLDESDASRWLEEYKASEDDDGGNGMNCMLSVRKEKNQCSRISPFDENYQVAEDVVFNDNDQEFNGSFYHHKLLDESVASERMDVPDGRSLRMRLKDGGDLDELVTNAEADGSVDYENNEDLPKGWKVNLNVSGGDVRFHASPWLDKSIAPEKQVQILTYFFNSYQMWIPWVYLRRYPGKCFSGDLVLQIMLLLI